MTHYIPAFTRENGRKRQAVCGVYIERKAHSAEPSCDGCGAWLMDDAKSFREAIAADPELAAYFPLDTAAVLSPLNYDLPAPPTPLDHELAEWRGIYLCEDCGKELRYPGNPQLCGDCEAKTDTE